MIDCRDEQGHYCGQDVETGEPVSAPDGKCGYCGPNCAHCIDYRVYSQQYGIYVCAADYDYEHD